MLCKRGLIYTICFLGAVLSSYSLSQLGIFLTLIAVGLLLCGIMVWRGRRPQDFVIENYLPRLFISTMWAIVFFVAYLVVRRVQPTNYRAYDLAALGIWFAFMAYSFWGQEWLQKIAWRTQVRS
jgi:hypothetical protein